MKSHRINHHFVPLFLGSVCFGTPKKTPASHPTTWRDPCRSSVLKEKISGGKKSVEREVMYLVDQPLYEVPWEPTIQLQFFLLFWLPIFGRAEKTSMVFGKPRVKRRVSLSIIGSFKPFKLTTHLSDPPSGNIELDPTPPERRMQSWQIKEGFFCFQGFLILKMFAIILVLTGSRGGV